MLMLLNKVRQRSQRDKDKQIDSQTTSKAASNILLNLITWQAVSDIHMVRPNGFLVDLNRLGKSAIVSISQRAASLSDS